MREGRLWGNSQKTSVEAGIPLEDRRELVAGDAGALALRPSQPTDLPPDPDDDEIEAVWERRSVPMGCTCGRGLRDRVAVRAAALPGDMAPAADVRCRRIPAVADRSFGRLNWAGKRSYRGRRVRHRAPPFAALVWPLQIDNDVANRTRPRISRSVQTKQRLVRRFNGYPADGQHRPRIGQADPVAGKQLRHNNQGL